ncbi:MAG TPA: hydrogenase maturation protease, partial [Candidatus Eisenbacteria bacterium]|nr:hydrogenase maturation protease [Candidatus Eisenbacteria bacterium]
MKTIVLGLGNTILSDDGAGIYAARAAREGLAGRADVVEAELAGFDLIEILEGYGRAIIIDAIDLDGEAPGSVFRLSPDDLRITPRLASFHDIDIVTAVALGKRLGLEMPSEILIYAVQVKDALTLNEGCTPDVEAAIPALAAEICSEVRGEVPDRISR